MRRSIRLTTRAALLALSAFCAASATAQDPAKVAPDLYKVRLENAKVRVLEVSGKAGQKAVMHSHPDYVVYSLGDGSVKFTDAKGATAEAPMQAGQTMWRGAESHASDVLSDFHVLLFELKGKKGMKPAKAATDDAVSADPEHYKVLLDNERVRVLEFRGAPGNKTPMHSHPNYVTYSFDGGTSTFTYPKGKPAEAVTPAGDVRWHKAETHAGQNTGQTELHVLIVEIK
jgi:beta-alanine degradation protein BauB